MATFTVTNTNNSGAGSLRQEILDANALKGKDIINFGGLFNDGLAHTISLTGSGLNITDDTIIQGTNPNLLTISDNSATRVFDITTAVTAVINGLTVTNTYNGYNNGTAGGGGISNEGTLTLNNSIITGNTVYHNALDTQENTISAGGGIYNTGSLTVNYSTISNNSAGDSYSYYSDGGGIYNTGSLRVKGSNITGNIIGDEIDSFGGGIYSVQPLKNGTNSNSVLVIDSTITNNSGEFGGGIYLENGIVSHSTISGNSADFGGGLYLINVTLSYSTITNNSVPANGGGIFSSGGTISYSTITNNSAGENGGGIILSRSTVSYSTISGNSAQDGGGGIYIDANGIINYSIISGNSAQDGGGIYAYSDGTVNHSIISGNTAKEEGGGIDVYLASVNSQIFLNVSDSTLSNNQAHFGGGIYNEGAFIVSKSIIKHNRAFGIELSSGKKESGKGGGIYNDSIYGGTTTLDYSTIACNFDTPEEDSTKFIKVDNLVGKFIKKGSSVRG
ncbi:MAG: right-handed parallel beta-helix repeat-containing protein [Nostoc sp.]|uniref:beta strand repeat-containing protein n=1 Tax=Nostoc sp. TaxID=1180 RepID=UPI002FF7B036